MPSTIGNRLPVYMVNITFDRNVNIDAGNDIKYCVNFLVCGPNSLNASVANSIAQFSTWNTVVDFRREAFEY